MSGATEMIHRIQTATRPTISLDATYDRGSSFSLLQTMSDPEGDRTGDVDSDETMQKLMSGLRPRERQVLTLRGCGRPLSAARDEAPAREALSLLVSKGKR